MYQETTQRQGQCNVKPKRKKKTGKPLLNYNVREFIPRDIMCHNPYVCFKPKIEIL